MNIRIGGYSLRPIDSSKYILVLGGAIEGVFGYFSSHLDYIVKDFSNLKSFN